MLREKNKAKYVSRAGFKFAGAAEKFKLNFKDKLVLDVGSSTGGFTDFALQNGAKKVIAVEVGTNQMHQKLRENSRVELREKTDILEVKNLHTLPDFIVIDVSFISLREILPHIFKNFSDKNTQIIAMVKPQFEAQKFQLNRGVVKNKTLRREIFKDFEAWLKNWAVIKNKIDSEITGEKGNHEKFYLLQKI